MKLNRMILPATGAAVAVGVAVVGASAGYSAQTSPNQTLRVSEFVAGSLSPASFQERMNVAIAEKAAADEAAAAQAAAAQQAAAQAAAAQSAPAASASAGGGYAAGGDVAAWANSGKSMSVKQCESGNNYSTNTGNGYYGAWQFDLPSWHANGGGAYASRPDLAPAWAQDQVAYNYYQNAGWGPWSCG